MPGGDRTGPMGMGPMTGRAAGYCGGFGMPGFTNFETGRGFGMRYGLGRGAGGRGGGRGMGGRAGGGRGWRHWYYATGLPGWMRFGGYGTPIEDAGAGGEKRMLESQAEVLQSQLDSIKKRLSRIQNEPGDE